MTNSFQNLVKAPLVFISACLFAGVILLLAPLFELKPVYLAAFLIICMVPVVLFRRPALLVAAIMFSRAILDTTLANTRLSIGGFHTGIGGLINFVVILLGVLFASKNVESFRRFPFLKPWTVLLVISAISIGYSPAKPDAVKLWVNLLTYPVMFCLPYCLIKSDRDKRYWLGILLGATLAASLLACATLIGRGARSADAAAISRISGTFSHPNILAFFVLFAMVLVFYLIKINYFPKYSLKEKGLIIYLIALFVILAATKTRSAWLACWVFFALYGVLKERRFLLLALILPPALFLIPQIHSRIADLFSHTHGSFKSGLNSWAWRKLLWQRSVGEIRGHLIFGQGLASFEPMSSRVMGVTGSQTTASHNTFLQVLFETGLIGLCAFLAIFYRLIRVIVKYARRILAMSLTRVIALLLVIGYAITCFGDNLLYYLSYNWYFWFFLGILTQSIQNHDD